MDEEQEEEFLTNAALGTDLLTSYVAATGDEPQKPGGCLNEPRRRSPISSVGIAPKWAAEGNFSPWGRLDTGCRSAMLCEKATRMPALAAESREILAIHGPVVNPIDKG